jgi:hypothetical protein
MVCRARTHLTFIPERDIPVRRNPGHLAPDCFGTRMRTRMSPLRGKREMGLRLRQVPHFASSGQVEVRFRYVIVDCIIRAPGATGHDCLALAFLELVRGNLHDAALAYLRVYSSATDAALVHRGATLVWRAMGHHPNHRADCGVDH